MKKKLIALAVAGALAVPVVASAQGTNVTIFGRVQAEYSGVDNGNTPYQSGISDNSRSSRWGLQITEDLGRGLKANARMEMGLNTGAGAASTPREQWVGLSSNNWGDVKFGRVQSPFKDFAGGMTIDPFAYTTLQANGAGGTMTGSANGMGSGANSFVNSAIRFDSVNVTGFSFAGMLMPGDANSLDPGQNTAAGLGGLQPAGLGAFGNTGGKDGEFDGQAAGKYVFNYAGFDASLFGGYSRDNASAAQKALGLRAEENWRVGTTLKYENFQVVGQYERVVNAIGAATCSSGAALAANPLDVNSSGQCNSAMNLGADGDIWHVGTNYKWGNTLLVAQGGMTKAEAGGIGASTAARENRSFTVGAIHSLSKRTSLFGGFQRVSLGMPGSGHEDQGTQDSTRSGVRNTWTIGMRHNF